MYSNISQNDYTNYSNLFGQISIKGKTPFQIIDFLKLDIFEIPRLELKLLLTLRYLRHYPTFSNLGAMFGISESYANKIFHKTIDYLLKFIHPKKSGELSLDDVCTVVIDVAEQEIERPVKKQRSYYSGKKNDTL